MRWREIKALDRRNRFLRNAMSIGAGNTQTRSNCFRTNRSMSRRTTNSSARKGAARQPQHPQPVRRLDEYSASSIPGRLLNRNPMRESRAIFHRSQLHPGFGHNVFLFFGFQKNARLLVGLFSKIRLHGLIQSPIYTAPRD
jgi:hypothetical protein